MKALAALVNFARSYPKESLSIEANHWKVNRLHPKPLE